MRDVITVEPGVAEATLPTDVTPRAPVPAPRSTWTVRMAVLTGALVLLVIADLLLLPGPRDPVVAQREPALTAARLVALDLSSIGGDNAEQRLAGLATATTGRFRTDLNGYAGVLTTILRQNQVTARATVTAAGLERIDTASALALVSVRATVTDAARPEGEVRRYRLAIDLRLEQGRWLVSSVEYVE